VKHAVAQAGIQPTGEMVLSTTSQGNFARALILEKIAFSHGMQRSVKISAPPRPALERPDSARGDEASCCLQRPPRLSQRFDARWADGWRPACAAAAADGARAVQVIEARSEDLIATLKQIPDILTEKKARSSPLSLPY